MVEEELRKKVTSYKVLESRLKTLLARREAIARKIIELDKIIESINDLKDSKDIVFSLGSEAHAFGTINKKSFIVEIGAGIAIERDAEGSISLLKKRTEELKSVLKDIDEASVKIVEEMNKLKPEIEKLLSDGEYV